MLKDFRDRDRRFGKRTLLLRHGKRATCVASGAALAAGNVLLLAVLAWLALAAHGAPAAFLAVLTALLGADVARLAASPEQAVVGYKG